MLAASRAASGSGRVAVDRTRTPRASPRSSGGQVAGEPPESVADPAAPDRAGARRGNGGEASRPPATQPVECGGHRAVAGVRPAATDHARSEPRGVVFGSCRDRVDVPGNLTVARVVRHSGPNRYRRRGRKHTSSTGPPFTRGPGERRMLPP